MSRYSVGWTHTKTTRQIRTLLWYEKLEPP